MENKKTKVNEKFNASEHLVEIKGKPYLPVAWRLVWFREEHLDWGIETEVVVKVETKSAIAKATIKNEKGFTIAVAHKTENSVGFGDYVEKAETGAIGRALAMCGYGTQFSPELDEFETKIGEPRVVDSPVEKSKFGTSDAFNVVTPAQSKLIFGLMKDLGFDDETAKDMVKKKFGLESFSALTKVQASELIETLINKKKELGSAAANEDTAIGRAIVSEKRKEETLREEPKEVGNEQVSSEEIPF